MWRDLGINLVASVVFSAATWLALRAWAAQKERFGQDRVKLTYYRVLRLSLRARGDSPYYERTHHAPKIAAREGPQPVYDEVWCLNSSFSRLAEIPEDIRITSTGVVDAIQVLPVVAQDADNHPHTRDNPGMFTATHGAPTTRLMAAGTLVNGLQETENRWFATTAQHDGQTLVLVADFSSLPFASDAVRNLHAIASRNKQPIAKESLVSNWYEERVSDDIYIVRLTDAKKNDVIRIDFQIDEARVPVRG
jgi:hypothetical protein